MNTNKFVLIIVALVIVVASPQLAVGGTTWDGGGGDNNFGTGANWNDNNTPPTGTTVDLNFAGSTRLTPFNNYGNWDDFRSIYFDSAAGSFTISGNAIDFFDGKIENNSSSDQSLNISDFSFNNGSQEVNPVSGNLTLGGGGNIYNNGQQMDVFGNSGYTLTIGKTVTGSGGITIKQNSVVNITAAQTYTGDTFIDAGSFRINEGGSLGSTTVRLGLTSGSAAASFYINDANGGTTEDAAIVVRNGSSGTKTIGGLNTSGDNTISSTISLDDNLTLSAASGGRIIFSGAITDGLGAGTFGVGVNAAGTVRLSGSGANSGSTWTIQAGTLELNKNAGTDAIAGTTTVQSGGTLKNIASNQINDGNGVTVNSNGSWDVNGQNETVASLDVDGSLSLGAGQVIMNGGGGTWSGTVSASSGGYLVFKGGGTTSLTGNNSGLASGSALYVEDGVTVGLNNNNAAGSSTIHLGSENGSTTAKLDSSVSDTTIGANIVVRSGSSGNKTIDNATTSGSRQITFNGNVSLADTLYVDASSGETTVFGGVISNTAGIVKRGFGTMTIGGVSTFGGVMAVDEGSLRVASGGDLTSASNITIGSSTYNGGVGAADLTLASGASGIDRSIVVAGGAGSRLLASEGNNTVSGTITQSGNLTVSNSTGTLNLSAVTMNTSGNNDLNVNGAGNVSIGGTITAATGASEIFKNDAGTLTVSGDNSGSSYKLHLNSGTTILSSANSLGTAYSDKVNFDGASTLRVSANIAPASLGLRVGNGITGTVEVDNGNNLSVATLGSSSGTGTFNKTGTGTLTLTGTSTVANSNNVSAGTLFVGSGAALAGTTTVNNGGTLSGSGSVGATTIASGGTINPGNSPGTMTLTNGLTWSGGGNYNWQIFDVNSTAGASDGWDLINVTGGLWDISGLSSGNKFNINLWSLNQVSPDSNGAAANFDPTSSYTWEILTYASLNGTFNTNLFAVNVGANNGTGGFANSLSGGTFALSLDTNSKSLNLLFNPDIGPGPGPSPVPEPGTWAAAALLAGAAGYVRWRRRKEVEPKA